ncbi:MAG: hypothetical protein HPY90_14240 [Syntrophothermus sp.]|uniref:hypothetical protein n=1 Tax=Syntrophothermus sp. TaxID=2736299 RepID=UPI00257D9A32|nr:hypothetical protein [Syntrophothermus sp.]NSW84396.1 hypothetical protein [Syntrophothermus sp.]
MSKKSAAIILCLIAFLAALISVPVLRRSGKESPAPQPVRQQMEEVNAPAPGPGSEATQQEVEKRVDISYDVSLPECISSSAEFKAWAEAHAIPPVLKFYLSGSDVIRSVIPVSEAWSAYQELYRKLGKEKKQGLLSRWPPLRRLYSQ